MNPVLSSVFKIWKLEIAALAFATLMLVVLAVLLAVFDGKPSIGYFFTLNAVVSIIVTASEAPLLFAVMELIAQWKWILFTNRSRSLIDFERIDAASRGQLGCLRLGWKARQITFLYAGLLVVLLSPAISPAAQQLVQPGVSQKLIADENVTVPNAGRYSRGNEYSLQVSGFDPSRRGSVANVYADADFSMQSSVFYGLTHPFWDVVDKQFSFHCTSQDCTWPPYESLSVCSTCNDVTAKLETVGSSGTLYASLARHGPATDAHGNGTAFRLPNGLFVDNVNGWGYDDQNGVKMTALGTGNASQTISMLDSDMLIWSMAIIRVTGDSNNSAAVWPNLPVNATECALSYCINNYESSVSVGTLLQESTPVTNITRSPQSWQPTKSFTDTNLSPEQLSSIEFDDYFSVVSRTDLSIVSQKSGDEYNVSQNAVDSISSFFQANFATEQRVFNASSDGEIQGQLNGFYISTTTPEYSPSVMQALFMNEDLPSVFRSVAVSMSIEMQREADGTFDGRSKNVTGFRQESFYGYRISWPWISLHVILMIFGWLFLIVTMWQNRVNGQHGHAWKSNTLAVLKQGWTLEGLLEGLVAVEDMKEVARKNDATLFVQHKPLDHVDDEQLELNPR